MFKEKYTTTELVSKDVPLDPKDLGLGAASYKPEKDKILLSNDAYAIGEMLEILINITARSK
jgi:hypothetical protein